MTSDAAPGSAPGPAPGSAPGSASSPASYAAAAHAWSHHLREGGATPWDPRRWSLAAEPREPDEPGADEPDGADRSAGHPAPPSAAHLELLRRFNLAGLGPAPAPLADLLLRTPRPGRGPVDPPLPWSGAPRFGSPPLDPTALDDEQLLALAVGALVRLLPGAPPATPATPGVTSRALPWRPRFVLHGTRLAQAAVQERLLAAGAVEGGHRPLHLVLGLPLEQAVAEHWTGRVGSGATLGWGALWRRTTSSAGGLPASVDVDRTAARLAADGARVQVVLAPDHLVLADAAARVLGRAHHGRGTPDPRPLHLARWDLQRRVNRLAPLARGPVTGAPLARRLGPVLAALAPTVPEPVRVPTTHVDAAARTAADLARRVREGGYPVHGDPGLLARLGPRGDHPRGGSVGSIDPAETLDLALRACLRLWRTQEGTRT